MTRMFRRIMQVKPKIVRIMLRLLLLLRLRSRSAITLKIGPKITLRSSRRLNINVVQEAKR